MRLSPHIADGSSPLTRGKRFTVGGDAQVTGLIPAHAGKTARDTGVKIA